MEWRNGNPVGENIRDMVINVSSLIGLNEVEGYETMIYPNPTYGICALQSAIQLSNHPTVIVFDSYGDIISKSKIRNHQSKIDLSSYPAGIYFVKILWGDSVSVKKIVKM